MEHDNTNRGAIWGNKDKKTDTHPDFSGSINVEGKEYWLKGWKRKAGANPNSPAMNLAVAIKEDQQIQQPVAVATEVDEDDVPF